jgi:hypothetical protein
MDGSRTRHLRDNLILNLVQSNAAQVDLEMGASTAGYQHEGTIQAAYVTRLRVQSIACRAALCQVRGGDLARPHPRHTAVPILRAKPKEEAVFAGSSVTSAV